MAAADIADSQFESSVVIQHIVQLHIYDVNGSELGHCGRIFVHPLASARGHLPSAGLEML